MMTYDEALDYLNKIPPFIPKQLAPGEEPFNLEKVTALLHKLGDPQNELRFVHVTGSNGKGSTSAYLTAILTSAGYRTGLYTSPAVLRINERIRIGDEQISDEDFARYTERVREVSLKMEAEGEGFPSEFEQMTAISMLYFMDCRCDLVILEVGLGGRLDATNVIPAPLLAVFTPISLEHTQVLGDTLTKIAAEKAGIIKEGSLVLTAPQSEEVRQVLLKVCGEKKVSLVSAPKPLWRHFDGEELSFALSSDELSGERVFRSQLAGPYQADNASLAIEAALLLRTVGFSVSVKDLEQGVCRTKWPCRFELLGKAPWIIVDGSHNPAGVRELARGLREYFPGKKMRFLVGVLADKGYEEMLLEMLPLAECFFTVAPASPRALNPETLASFICSMGGKATACADAKEAVRLSLDGAGPDSVICAFGSLYEAGEFKRTFLEMM